MLAARALVRQVEAFRFRSRRPSANCAPRTRILRQSIGSEYLSELELNCLERLRTNRLVGGGNERFQVTFGGPPEHRERESLGVDEPLVWYARPVERAQLANCIVRGVGRGSDFTHPIRADLHRSTCRALRVAIPAKANVVVAKNVVRLVLDLHFSHQPPSARTSGAAR